MQPAPIRKLEETVINRIAAGEIINRPSNALKELIENSLDAGSTSISIAVKDGGLKVLQIQDNGHGIRTEDMPIVCERFTTSKLKVYEDLSHIQTYGFRGEALASISHVSHLSITTKQADSECAFKAHYADGKLVPAKPGGSSDPVPCAGNNGTVITAEDLFYNIPSRKAALKNIREEYNRIFEVASRYAIHNSGIAFSCRKYGAPKVDLSTVAGASTITNIRQIFGSKIANSLVEIKDSNADFDVEFSGHVSSAAHEMHKTVFLLFINHRLVEHTPIRRAIESLYSSVLPKASRPFVYLDLRIKPENVDVNVHPTKREVRFLNEDGIVGCIVDCIHNKLLSSNGSREFVVQERLQKQLNVSTDGDTPSLTSIAPSNTISDAESNLTIPTPTLTPTQPVGSTSSSNLPTAAPRKTPVNRAVRTNYKTLSLESFSFGSSPSIRRNRLQTTIDSSVASPPRNPLHISPSHANSSTGLRDEDDFMQASSSTQKQQSGSREPLFGQETAARTSSTGKEHNSAQSALHSDIPAKLPQLSEPAPTLGKTYAAPKPEPRVEVRLTSILNLRKELQKNANSELTQILSEHSFVGFVDDRRALIQHQTRLYMIDYCKISYHLFYHRCIFDFMNYGRIILQPAPSVYDLALMAAKELGDVDPEDTAKNVLSRFSDSREMLEEYYHIRISDVGTIESLPMVIRDYSPDYDKLPLFLYNASSSVNWEDEQQFFKTFTSELATFYALEPPLPDDPPHTKDEYRLVIEHRIMPSFKGSSFWAPGSILMENSLVQLADLPDLYRIFERC